jgi:hypothetical protein
MMTVTDEALDEIVQAVNKIEQPVPDEACVRLAQNDQQQIILGLDIPNENDHKYERNGSVILIVAKPIANALDGRTLDANEQGELYLK